MPIEKPRASRAGHAFHEAWAARSALELLPPGSTLTAIAMEGFSVEDGESLTDIATEIADLVRYHGASDVARAERVEVVQFKYSIANADTPIRAADLAKTLRKFALTDAQLRGQHGDELVERVVRYDFATNRPIHPNLIAAIAALQADASLAGDAAKQAEQLREAVKETGAPLDSLISRLALSGGKGSLKQAEHSLQLVLASWSEGSDPESEKRLLKLRNLIRIKAGSEGAGNNLINRTAVLGELDVDHEGVLYPTEDAFPAVAHVIARPAVDDVIKMVAAETLPIIIHGAGGMGKTVLMQAVADRLRPTNHVVIFDGFGAGRWRDPADGRHRPQRTLVHLANLLAGEGLSDILLPMEDETSLVRAFRRRLEQAVSTARQASDEAGIVLVLDAIDHAALQAEATGQNSFAHLLLKSLSIQPIGGVKVIASCRTERLAQAVGGASYRDSEIPAFSSKEASQLILARDSSAGAGDIAALESRSGRNPRCLDMLLTMGRPYDGSRPRGASSNPSSVLDALLGQRIDAAKEAARAKGTSNADIDVLLSSLSILPPPVPIAELAAAHGLEVSVVESFAADLSPLLERTPHGLMFRDEPTETFIRGMTRGDLTSLERIVQQLISRQSVSDFAARALPAVLTALQRTDQLIELAFDARVPPGASKVSQRDIRLARIVSALAACARAARYDDLLRVLLEASLVAAGHGRSDQFLYEHPDLAAVLGDAEALRRLFATKVGWPGGRHSALAIANAFSGEVGEAKRNAQRAIDWFNWSLQQPESQVFDSGGVSAEWDDIGFAYVEMIAGDDGRLARWLARRPEGEAYRKYCDLLDLLERHATSADESFAPRKRVLARLSRCRIPGRPLWAAALTYSSREEKHDRRLISKLARAPVPEKPEAMSRSSLLTATARAIQLGMPDEGRAILAGHQGRPVSVYDFTDAFSTERGAEQAVIAAGLAAAIRGTPANLLDLVPEELSKLAPPSVVARGPNAYLKHVTKKLGDANPTSGRVRKPSKSALSYDERSRYRNALHHRIQALVPYADFVARMVSPRAGETVTQILGEALDRLEADVLSTSDYPYRDGKAFIGRSGFFILFEVADALDVIDQLIGERMVAWLVRARGNFTPLLTHYVERLSRSAELHDAALELAVHVERLVLSDTDTASRIASYGKLARAVWRTSPDEAAAYFRRGLDLADAVGSGDFDRTNHLLSLASQYRGAPLTPTAGHDLARIFELNLSEASKFPWLEYGQAMVHVAALASLAIVDRLDDRDSAGLGLTLAPLLTVLAEAGKLPPDLAACLVGLAEPVETWTWKLSTFTKAVLKNLPADRREWLFHLVLIEIDRKDVLDPLRETIRELASLAENHLPENSAARVRIEALAARQPPREVSPRTDNETSTRATDDQIDLGDSDALDRAIANEEPDERGDRWPQHTLKRLAQHATTITLRWKFLDSVARMTEASLSDKLYALEAYVPAWAQHSVALREHLPAVALALAAKHASDMVGQSWEANHAWRQLTTTYGGDITALAAQVIASLGATAVEVSGDSWLGLAAQLAPAVGDPAFAMGLERYLAHAGGTIPPEVGDGRWDTRFSVSAEPAEIVGGLIWSRLGNLSAASRWRAAHAVRRLADAGRFDVIDSIYERFDSGTALPFCDVALPFYGMHAQLWFLIALARVAKDHAASCAKYKPLLERIAFNREFPHVIMQAFAADALGEVVASLDSKQAQVLREKLSLVNISTLPRTENGVHYDFYRGRPDDVEKPDDKFHLDYEFNKSEVGKLARAFGCGGWVIEDSITRWARKWAPTVQSMHDCPRISKEDFNRGSWSSGSPPDVDRYGSYLGWHALMLSAGELIETHSVSEDRWDQNPLQSFVHDFTLSRHDGRWVSDATDLSPIDLTTSFSMPDEDTESMDPEDRRVLAPLLGIEDGVSVGDALIVSGHWSLADNLNVTVRSVLADQADADAVIFATLTDGKFHHWLPNRELDLDLWSGKSPPSIQPWLESEDHPEMNLDQHDPYASPTATRRPHPESWVLERYGISQVDPYQRAWMAMGKLAFEADAWGARGGKGDWAWNESGIRIVANTAMLGTLLAGEQRVLIGFVKAQRYVAEKAKRSDTQTGAFTHRVMMFTVDADGIVKIVSEVPGFVDSAVAKLDDNESMDYLKRFKAIRAASVKRARH